MLKVKHKESQFEINEILTEYEDTLAKRKKYVVTFMLKRNSKYSA